jgi:hypothetical protein
MPASCRICRRVYDFGVWQTPGLIAYRDYELQWGVCDECQATHASQHGTRAAEATANSQPITPSNKQESEINTRCKLFG